MATPPRIALVTGAAHRIGAGIASDLAEHGYDVVLHAHRSRDAAGRLAKDLAERHGVRTAVVTGDLSSTDAVDAIVPKALAALGGLTVLINNAALFEADDPGNFASSRWRTQMAVNAEAPARLISAFADQAPLAQGSRLAVNMIDQRVFKPTPRHFSYSASKATLYFITRTMAQAFAPHVRVNALGPGPVLKAAAQNESDFAAQVAALPLQRSPKPAEFGQAIRFLDNAPSITGQMIALDGGQHIAWQTPDALVNE
ncbi:MAG: SDR family oxidoreductase [Pseudomonadota bacterium]